MKFLVKVNIEEHLENQLYSVSSSPSIKKKRKRNIWIVPLFYLAFAITGYFSELYMMAGAFGLLAVLWYFFYPKYQAKKYYNHYRHYVNENYADQVDSEVSIELQENEILFIDAKAESKVKIDAVNYIVELPKIFLLNIGKGKNIVLPKKDLENNAHTVSNFIATLKTENKISFRDETNWAWS